MSGLCHATFDDRSHLVGGVVWVHTWAIIRPWILGNNACVLETRNADVVLELSVAGYPLLAQPAIGLS